MCSQEVFDTELCRLCQINLGINVISKSPDLSNTIKAVTHIEVNDEYKHYMPDAVCLDCTTVLMDAYKLIKSSQQINKNLKKLVKKKLEKEKSSYVCCVCTKRYIKKVAFDAHRINHMEIYCNICNNIFDSPSDKNNHLCGKLESQDGFKNEYESFKNSNNVTIEDQKINLQTQTNNSSNISEPLSNDQNKKPFLCLTCGKRFPTKNSINCHEKIHNPFKMYKCLKCKLDFSVRSNLQAHIKKYHKGMRFSCSQCMKQFLNKDSLDRHEKVHKGVREFQCEKCSSAFYTNKELVKHQRYHQGLKQYKCEKCFKAFFEKHHLIVHRRSHTGERPFVCDVVGCKKAFIEKQKLKRHKKTVHDRIN